MTPDVDAIRQALTAATPAPWKCWNAFTAEDHFDMEGNSLDWMCTVRIGNQDGDGLTADGHDIEGTRDDLTLVANAPVWLASLCDEVQSLNALLAHMQKQRDAALKRCERLQTELEAKS